MSGVKCREVPERLVDFARGRGLSGAERAELDAHLASCEGCRLALRRQVRLTTAMNAMVAETARAEVPGGVERVLQAEFAAAHRPRRVSFGYAVVGGAMAAMLALVWFVGNRPTVQVRPHAPVEATAVPVPPTETVAVARTVRPVVRRRVTKEKPAQEQPFVAIPYTMPLDPYERADVMRVDLPVTALIAAGFSTSMMDPGATARADVLVGQDGRARAIRLVSILN